MVDNSFAAEIIERTKPVIELLSRVLLEVKAGDVTREIYDDLRMKVGWAMGKVFDMRHDLERAYPEHKDPPVPSDNSDGETANERIADLLPSDVATPLNGMTREYAEAIQAKVLKAIRLTHDIFAARPECENELKMHIGRIIGRLQEIFEIVIAIYPDLDDLKDVELPEETLIKLEELRRRKKNESYSQ